MLCSSKHASDAIPKEYRHIVQNLFPENGYAAGKGPTLSKILAFAEILGLGDDNKRFFKAPVSADVLNSLLHSFQNNLDLLIQKTWVEKAEENRKENLLDRLPAFIAGIGAEKYSEALEEFGAILEELAWLLFGAQSRNDDFTEYSIRIDVQLGLFWWYGNQLSSPRALEWIKRTDKEIQKALLFLGICFLTNF